MSSGGRLQTILVLTVFAVVFSALAVTNYMRNSSAWDEPQHLTAGCLALMRSDYRLDPEHPPLLRMWAAAALSRERHITLNTDLLPARLGDDWLFYRQFLFGQDFLFRQNDADALLNRSRFMIVLLGIGLGILLFSWARELFGFWPAVVVLGLYCTEPNVLAHASVIGTDFGVTVFIFGTSYFTWKTTRVLNAGNLVGLTAFFSLALVSKSSAILLGPIIVVLLATRVVSRLPWPCKLGRYHERTTVRSKALTSAMILSLMFGVSYITLWAAYSFRYAPSPVAGSPDLFVASQETISVAPRPARIANWIDRHHLLPNAYTQGLVVGLTKAQRRASFLAGSFSDIGWWYYFPVAFALKTPVALILLFLAGLLVVVKRRHTFLQDGLFVLLPLAVYLGAAMASKLNIGVRHILPIYPFVIITAGAAVAEMLSYKKPSVVATLVALCLFQVAEVARAAPHYLAFFNVFAGGPSHGHEYLIDSNLDWGQDLKRLKQWMDKNRVTRINLSYFGMADPTYYGIEYTRLPAAFVPLDQIQPPQLPGYVAVSVTNLRGLYLNDNGKAFYRPLLERKPDAVIGYSIYVYWVERPWWSR